MSTYLTLVEKHSIDKDSPFYSIYYNSCLQASKVYNQALYQQRKRFFAYRDKRDEYCNSTGLSSSSVEVKDYLKSEGLGILSAYDLDKELNKCDEFKETYHSIPTASSQVLIQSVSHDMNSFMRLIVKNQSSLDKNKVSLPRYKKKDSPTILTLSTNNFKLKDDAIIVTHKLLKDVNKNSLTIRVHAHNESGFISYQQLKFKVLKDKIEVYVYYRKKKLDLKSDNCCYLSIDLGVNNYVTMSSNIGLKPVILNGKGLLTKIYTKQQELKRLQSIFDKTNSTKQKTTKRMQSVYKNLKNYQTNFEHHISKYIVEYALKHNINTIVVGYNKSWKSESNLGQSNLLFQKISYTGLLHKLKYKCELQGLNYVDVEESYTSGTSFLDLEQPTKINYNKSRRIYRGLFKSNTGKFINSDVNSSYQILKKHKKDVYDDVNLVGSLLTIPLKISVL